MKRALAPTLHITGHATQTTSCGALLLSSDPMQLLRHGIHATSSALDPTIHRQGIHRSYSIVVLVRSQLVGCHIAHAIE